MSSEAFVSEGVRGTEHSLWVAVGSLHAAPALKELGQEGCLGVGVIHLTHMCSALLRG